MSDPQLPGGAPLSVAIPLPVAGPLTVDAQPARSLTPSADPRPPQDPDGPVADPLPVARPRAHERSPRDVLLQNEPLPASGESEAGLLQTSLPQTSAPEMDLFPEEPPAAFTYASFEALLRWGAGQPGMSDVKFVVTQPVWLRAHGRWIRVTRRALTAEELNALLAEAYRSPTATALLQAGHTLDWTLEVRIDRATRLRFRCNATLVLNKREGVSMTLRLIPTDPPALEDMRLPPALISGLLPSNGLVLVTGVMGSGKSTLLAGILRRIAESEPRAITTFEAPIEFDYSRLALVRGPVEQSAVGPGCHLQSFDEAVRSASRRACDVVLVGEARDAQTLRHMIEFAEMGPAVYSTVHTRGVAETPGRIVHTFDVEEQPVIIASLIDCIRCIVQQRLLPNPAGGRTAVREYLVFDQDMRDALARQPLHELKAAIARFVDTRGQTLLSDAQRHLEAGRLREEDYRALEHERRRFNEALHV